MNESLENIQQGVGGWSRDLLPAGGEDHLCRGQVQAGGGRARLQGVRGGEHYRLPRSTSEAQLFLTDFVAEETCTMDPTQDCRNVTTR